MTSATLSAPILLIGFLGAAATAGAQTYEASVPDTTIAVEPGGSVDIPVTIVNHDGAESPELHLVMPSPIGDYTFEQRSEPECGPIVPSTTYEGWTESTIAPIAAGGARTCTIRATRNAGEINNGFIDWVVEEGGQSWIYVKLGTFVDIGIAATKIGAYRSADGTTHASYRIDARNASAVDAENVTIQVGSACAPSGIVVDVDPGMCSLGQLDCGFGGAAAPTAIVSALAGGATASCIVRLSAQPGADLAGAAALVPSIENAVTGGFMDDDNPDNDVAPLDLQPQQRGHSAHAAPRPRQDASADVRFR